MFMIFNSYYSRLQFTNELENDGMLSFLDTIVIWGSVSFITNWLVLLLIYY